MTLTPLSSSSRTRPRAAATGLRFALVDLQVEGRRANREHTGGFGSFMSAEGVVGGAVSALKARLIQLPVMTFATTASLLRTAGHQVAHSQGGQLGSGTDVVIIASSMHCYADEVAFAQAVKRAQPDARVGFYGPFAHTRPEFFEAVADFIIGGELESTILAFVDGDAEFDGMLDHGPLADLGRLPAPDWDGMPVHRFSYFPMLHQRPMLPVQSTRGCSFNCDFCPYMVSQTKRFRRRDPEAVLDELEQNVRRWGMRSFLFRDICFTLHQGHAAAIAEGILRRGLKLEWGCETRLDCLSHELIEVMVRSGLRGMNLGIESASTDILSGAGKKNPTVAHQEEMIGALTDAGVRVNGFFMLGLPGDTEASMNDTIAYAARLNTQGAQFCVTTPFPGTPLFEDQREHLLTEDYTAYTEYAPVMDIGTSTPEQVAAAHGRAFRHFYLRPDWMWRHGAVTAAGLAVNRLGNRKLAHRLGRLVDRATQRAAARR